MCRDNPKGIVASSPRLARQRLPWVNAAKRERPQRGCGNHRAACGNGMAASAWRLGCLVGCGPGWLVPRDAGPWDSDLAAVGAEPQLMERTQAVLDST